MSALSVTNVDGVLWSAANATCNATALHLARQPDADVAGIGVILSFLIPSFVSVFGVIIGYWAGLINDELLTTADREFFRVEDRVLMSTSGKMARWAEGMQKGILWFSDVQLIFGVGLLISGVSQLRYISIYHIQMVTYQAWMSSNVHLVSLTVLRDYFRENKILRHARVTGMLILAVLLLVALIPTSSTTAKQILLGRLTSASEPYGFNAPARCFFTANKGLAGPIDPDAPWSFILLAVSYLWKISCLYEPCRCAFLQYVRATPLSLVEGRLIRLARRNAERNVGFLHRRRYNLLLIIYIMLVMIFDFFASFALSLYFLALNLAWGTVQILVPRFAFNASSEVSQDENTWNFGQILPLLLLLLPPLALLEHFYGHTNEDRTPSWKMRMPNYQPDYFSEVEDHAPRLPSVAPSESVSPTEKMASTREATYGSIASVTSETRLLTTITTVDTITAPSASSPTTTLTPSATLTKIESKSSAMLLAPAPPMPSPPLAPQNLPLEIAFQNSAEVAPLDLNCAIHEFFLKDHLTKHERITLHLLFYQSRTFQAGMVVMNLATIAVICELVILVLLGHSTGELWVLTLGIPGVGLVVVFLVFICGARLRSRLFKRRERTNKE